MFIKVIQGSSTRKFKLNDQATLSELRKELQRLIGADADNVNICYKDSDGEVISILSDEDWNVCFEEFTLKCKDKPVVTVTIQLNEGTTSSKLDATDNQSFSHTQTEFADIKEEPKLSIPVIDQEKVIEAVISEPAQEIPPTEIKSEESEPKSVFEDEPHVEVKPDHHDAQQDDYVSCYLRVDDEMNDLTHLINNLIPGVEVVKAEIIEEDKPASDSLTQSTLTVDMKKEIESIVDERISKIISARNIPAPATPASQGFVHSGIFCDGCKSKIVDQPRYKSLVIADFDLCENCEKKGIHIGPMVKFPKPSVHSASRLNAFFNENLHDFFRTEAEQPQTVQPTQNENFYHDHPWGRFSRRRGWGAGRRCPYSNQRESSPLRESARSSFTHQTNSNEPTGQNLQSQPTSSRPGIYDLQSFFTDSRLPERIRNATQNVAPQFLNHFANFARGCTSSAHRPTAAPTSTQPAGVAGQAAPSRVQPPTDYIDELISQAEQVMGPMDKSFLREFIVRNNINNLSSLFENLY
jgi:PB1 domain/Zinc finger, ZZ type